MTDRINYAVREKQVNENPTIKDAIRLGETHCAYGWTPHPRMTWPLAQQAAYMRGYNTERAIHGKPPVPFKDDPHEKQDSD